MLEPGTFFCLINLPRLVHPHHNAVMSEELTLRREGVFGMFAIGPIELLILLIIGGFLLWALFRKGR